MGENIETNKQKNLANCKPSEFLRQTNRIRKAVAKWLTDTDILNIRKELPTLRKFTEDMSEDERKSVFEQNQTVSRKFAMDKLSRMLDSILEEHPEETIEILALMCFIEPEEAEEHPISEYISAFSELIGNKAVLDFFSSLMRLENSGILDTANQ